MEATVVVEHRPNLRVCQFFIKTRFYKNETNVMVEEDKLIISTQTLNLEIIMPEGVKLLKDSISGINYTQDSLMLRTQTIPDKNQGSFKTELLMRKSGSNKVELFTPNIEVGQKVNVYCRFCSKALTKREIAFRRILPLPDSSDSNDFFCHGQMDNLSLDPKVDDLFYGCYNYKVHPSILDIDDKTESVIMCNGCSSWIGNIDMNYIQIWNSTTILSLIPPESSTDVGLIDFLKIVKLNSNDILPANNKILMYCEIASNQTCYLLLWVMDKNLTLLTGNENPLSGKITLRDTKVVKLLYSYQISKTDIVRKWLSFSNINFIKISKTILEKAMEHLNSMTGNIPEDYRSSHNMRISYLEVCD